MTLLVLAGCKPFEPELNRIILDFPHGGLRLLLQRDGETLLFYGALPAHLRIEDGVFDLDEFARELTPHLNEVVPAENRPLGKPYGMATLEFSDGGDQDYLIYDQDFALELFQLACANLVEDLDAAGATFVAACSQVADSEPW